MSEPTQRTTSQKRMTGQYKEVMWRYYYTVAKGIDGGVTRCTFTIWRNRNQDIFPYMNSNALANQRQFMLKEEKFSGIEVKQIHADVNRMTGIATAPYEQNP